MGMNRKSLAAGAVLLAAIASLPRGAAAQAGGPYQYHAITPCRIADSRYTPANPPSGSIVPANHLTTGTSVCRDASPCTESQFTVAYRMRGSCGVPDAAKAITGNFTIVTPGAAGYIRMYPYNAADAALPMPLTATLLFNSNDVIGNGAIVPVGSDPVGGGPAPGAPDLAFYILAGGTNANLVVDVTGYFCAPGPC